MFDTIYGHLYFVAKTPEAEAIGISLLMYGLNLKKANLVVSAVCHTK